MEVHYWKRVHSSPRFINTHMAGTCTGTAHPSVHPPPPPSSWTLLHTSGVSFSPPCPTNGSRAHALVSQVAPTHGSPRGTSTDPLPTGCLCPDPVASYSLPGTAGGLLWSKPHPCTQQGCRRCRPSSPHSGAELVPGTRAWDWRSHSSQWSWGPHLLCPPQFLTVAGFQDTHCSCHSGWSPRPPPTVVKKRFNKKTGPTSVTRHRAWSDKRTLPAWARSCAACCRWPCFGRGVGLGDPQRSLPTPTILWFCTAQQCFTCNRSLLYCFLSIPPPFCCSPVVLFFHVFPCFPVFFLLLPLNIAL